MISGYPLWIVLLIGVGVFCASFVDAIGGGGGIISVPVYLLAGLPVHNALATNKMSACLGTVASTFRYLKSGFVDWALALPAVAFAIAGSYVGTRLHAGIHAMNRKVRSVILAVDNRAIEMGRDFNLPVIRREELEEKLQERIYGSWNTQIKIPVDSIVKWKKQFKMQVTGDSANVDF